MCRLKGIIYGAVFMAYNGPAVGGESVTRRSIRAGTKDFSQKFVPVQGGYGTCFCCHGTIFMAYLSVAVQCCQMSRNLSPYCYFVNSTGAVSRCKLARSTNLSPYKELTCEQSACPGTATSRDLSRRQERNAKTVTSFLPLPSVVRVRAILK